MHELHRKTLSGYNQFLTHQFLVGNLVFSPIYVDYVC